MLHLLTVHNIPQGRFIGATRQYMDKYTTTNTCTNKGGRVMAVFSLSHDGHDK